MFAWLVNSIVEHCYRILFDGVHTAVWHRHQGVTRTPNAISLHKIGAFYATFDPVQPQTLGGASLNKGFGLTIMMLGLATALLAGPGVPEIDGSTGMAAVALLAGGILVLRGRRKK